MITLESLKLVAEGLAAGFALFVLNLPTAALALIVLMAMDVVTGFLSAYITKTLDSKVSYVGLAKKALVLIAVAGASYMGFAVGLPTDLISTTIAGFYSMHEVLSILENLTNAGVPIPDFITKALAQANTSKGDA